MRNALSSVVGAAALVISADVRAELLPMDPGTNFYLSGNTSNNGYSSGRGMLFIANDPIPVNGASLWTADATGLNATFELYETITNVGNVSVGATLLRSVNTTLIGSLDFWGAKFDPITLTPGQSYLLRVFYDEAADENWFYDFDPVVFGDPPVDIGPITLIDGTNSFSTVNFVAPYLALQIVPAPGTVVLLGLAGLMGTRRRRALTALSCSGCYRA